MTTQTAATAKKVTYTAESGAYSYILTPAHGLRHTVLKLRVSRKLMEQFKATGQGKEVGHMIDCFEQGNGWYEITDNDAYVARMSRRFGAQVSGVMSWLKHWNSYQLQLVNANKGWSDVGPFAYTTATSASMRAEADKAMLAIRASALAAKFGKKLGVA